MMKIFVLEWKFGFEKVIVRKNGYIVYVAKHKY